MEDGDSKDSFCCRLCMNSVSLYPLKEIQVRMHNHVDSKIGYKIQGLCS